MPDNVIQFRAGASPTSLPAQTAGGSSPTGSPADPYVRQRVSDALRDALQSVDWVYATQCVHNEYADAAEDGLELVKAIEAKCRAIRNEARSRNGRFFF